MRDFLADLRGALSDRYDIDEEIGHGTMAAVFRAHDRAGRDVAIKVLRPEFSATILADRFHREINLLRRLRHPNVLPILDTGDHEKFLFFVTPLAGGGSLLARLGRSGPFSIADTIAIARDVAAGIDYAHERRVIHRDIKPGNVLFADDRAVLCDFGVARAIVRASDTDISSSGFVVGTPEYMSPEQTQGTSAVDTATDIYALGCLVYEMLVGEPPFTGRTAQLVMAKHAKATPPRLRTVRQDAPAAVEDAFRHALAKNPADRPRTAARFIAELTGGGSPR